MQAKKLWKWSIEHNVHRIAILVMREQNTLADHLSVSDACVVFVITDLFSLWGNLIILFASRSKRKCQKFCSRAGRDRESISEAFLVHLGQGLIYAFPLIQRGINKIRQDKGSVILIVPAWPRPQ